MFKMSLFRKPKKTIQRRVFSRFDDDGDNLTRNNSEKSMQMDVEEQNLNYKKGGTCYGKRIKNEKFSRTDCKTSKTKSLLSFADDDEEDEIFQVRKSSHSKKVMRMMNKERRKKRAKEEKNNDHESVNYSPQREHENDKGTESSNDVLTTISNGDKKCLQTTAFVLSEVNKSKKSDNIETEIRTDDFVLVVKKSEPALILDGIDSICSGKDDMSDDNERVNSDDTRTQKTFSKAENLKQMLENGSIPDATMIHAARKRRQKAREQGVVIPVEDPNNEENKKAKQINREDEDEVENSGEEERINMNAVTGKRELEERREKFYSVENYYSDDDSDHDTNEWENQQIRKGVTGAQLLTAQHGSVISKFIIKSSNTQLESTSPQSTITLLDEAYTLKSIDKSLQLRSNIENDKNISALRTPPEITASIQTRLMKIREHNRSHKLNINRISTEMKALRMNEIDCSQKAPTAAAKYRFYQEINGYVENLVECLNEKVPKINDLEKRAMQILSKHPSYLIERRRQDVRDQVKEMTESSNSSAMKRVPENEEIIKRTAERECRRTRRRCEREKCDISSTHLDGMSSDDEVSDHVLKQKKLSIDQLQVEVDNLFADAGDDFCKPEFVLSKFNVWRKTDMDSYKDAFVSLCLPKVMAPFVRTETVIWNPLSEDYKDIENMSWYSACMLFGLSEMETEDSLLLDPDVKLVPIVIEKILLPKVTEIVNNCWDPMSTTQNLRLIGFINRVGRDYPIQHYSNQLQKLFNAILEKLKSALYNDVFIPIFPKQVQEARTSFFQRQLCSGLKLFRNFLSWQGIIADKPLIDLAISSLLNRYLLLATKICSINDALSKVYIVVNTLPTVWLQPESETLQNLHPLILFIKSIVEGFDPKNPLHMQSCDKAKKILQRLHSW
ncbi:PAX3- and PAX7-binding protein 1 isoform X2 [Eupeodes corollae]|uniref:PAX3- and PAX7-binding protein 1 isoform X2 n=1 Tax=Eupeodes corollae TaxID=290404 RepID=UPI002493CFA9|nr:PAX3- and PAX7-binding protein 1 isoform X2 [Eupeodes corollae]